jgi:hypothetical protein
MSGLVPYEGEPSYDEQMRAALEKALTIQGTTINDLESAINCILQMERAMTMTGTPNPSQVTAKYLKQKYKMGKQEADSHAASSRLLLEQGKSELVEGKRSLPEWVDGNDWCDDCHRRVRECQCP